MSPLAITSPAPTTDSPLAKLIDLCDQLEDQCVLTDEYGCIIYANAATARETGFDRGQLEGKGIGDLCGGRMPLGFYADLWKRLAVQKLPFMGMVRNLRKDGASQWREMYVFPLRGPHSRLFYCAIEPDIRNFKERNIGLELFSIYPLFSHEMSSVRGFYTLLLSSLDENLYSE